MATNYVNRHDALNGADGLTQIRIQSHQRHHLTRTVQYHTNNLPKVNSSEKDSTNYVKDGKRPSH